MKLTEDQKIQLIAVLLLALLVIITLVVSKGDIPFQPWFPVW